MNISPELTDDERRAEFRISIRENCLSEAAVAARANFHGYSGFKVWFKGKRSKLSGKKPTITVRKLQIVLKTFKELTERSVG